ncbi:MAG: tRNA lysidine(34) synthetase TilS [Oscillospiraceae bacterium]|nr:tRNA lysidine(34) synthetase TilS [Oscillospiraceae bacterium]
MKDRLLSFLEDSGCLPERGAGILAAVSGGADSMCLLDLLLSLSPETGWEISAAHFNHGLRGPEADRDEAFVRDYCSEAGIPFFAGRGDVNEYASLHRIGREEAARVLRYRFLEEARKQAEAKYIATAHSADDNAETILMNLVRGTGAAGLRGIPVCRESLIRPLLFADRAEIEAYDRARGLSWITDSSNGDDTYTRNRLRLHVIPLLKQINPRFTEACSRTAQIAAADDDALNAMADSVFSGLDRSKRIPSDLLGDLPDAVAARVLRKMNGGPLPFLQVRRILLFCRSGRREGVLEIPGTEVHFEHGDLVFGRTETVPMTTRVLAPGTTVPLEEAGLIVTVCEERYDGTIHKSFTEYLFKTGDVCGRIVARPRFPGDRYAPRGRGCTKTLKKLMNEAGIPISRRDALPVFADEKGILAVYPFGPCERGRPENGDAVIRIQIREM